MAERKKLREKKRQLGQFMTPMPLARRIVSDLPLTDASRVLEPSFGTGSFLVAVVERLMELGGGTERERFRRIMSQQVFGVEIDPALYGEAIEEIEHRWGPLPSDHNLTMSDFFRVEYLTGTFDVVVGNPPYGGTFDPKIEDRLDCQYGRWNGHKLKKETYSFFIARSLDWLAIGGILSFVSSDTFMTISTMGGLRRRLMDETTVRVTHLNGFSDETKQPVLILSASKTGPSGCVVVDGRDVAKSSIEMTGNFSWGLDRDLARYFAGPSLSEYMIGSGGMTIGKNELFVRDVGDGSIVEPFRFEFFDDPITLQKELERARLGKLSPTLQRRIRAQQLQGETRRNVRVVPLPEPLRLPFPHPDYLPYNKADSAIIYCPPRYAVYWKDDGDAVLTFKKNGNWYLQGVGGQPYFGREGVTWQLVSPRLKMRYLPSGYILDSGAPCGFLRPDVDADELWFILGWAQTELATTILKTVINHTRNVQSKDIERLPYPWWVSAGHKAIVVQAVKQMVAEAQASRVFSLSDPEIVALNDLFAAEELQERTPRRHTGLQGRRSTGPPTDSSSAKRPLPSGSHGATEPTLLDLV